MWSNYALKKTPLDCKDVWGSKVSDTLRRNFYVDSMLKSLKFEEEAVELMKDVKLMCKSGRLHLKKFSKTARKFWKQCQPAIEEKVLWNAT